MTDELEQMSPNQRRALDKALSALEAFASIWAVEIRLSELSARIALLPDEAERAKRIAAMIEQGFIEGAYRHYLDHKDKCDEIAATRDAAPQAAQNDADHIVDANKKVDAGHSVLDEKFAEAKKHIADLQKALFYWMPSIAGQPNSDGERAANDAYLLFGWAAGDEENCYGDRARDAALEEAATLCESQGRRSASIDDTAFYIALSQAAAAIRSLKSAPPQNIGSVASDKIFRDQANKESK